jgi:hypothetical protein
MRKHTLVRQSVQAVLLTVLALILAVGVTPAAPTAASTTTHHYVVRDNEVFAFWSYDVPGGCGHVNLLIDAFTSVISPGSPSGGSPAILVIYNSTDMCHGSPFNGAAFTNIPAGSLKVTRPHPGLSASLGPVPVTLTDATGATVDLVINLNWTSTTPPTTIHGMERISGGGMVYSNHILANKVDTPAIGSVMLGTRDLTPLASDSGFVYTDISGNLTITRY